MSIGSSPVPPLLIFRFPFFFQTNCSEFSNNSQWKVTGGRSVLENCRKTTTVTIFLVWVLHTHTSPHSNKVLYIQCVQMIQALVDTDDNNLREQKSQHLEAKKTSSYEKDDKSVWKSVRSNPLSWVIIWNASTCLIVWLCKHTTWPLIYVSCLRSISSAIPSALWGREDALPVVFPCEPHCSHLLLVLFGIVSLTSTFLLCKCFHWLPFCNITYQ